MTTKQNTAKTAFTPSVCADRQRRTCMSVHEKGGVTFYIPLSVENGFNVEELPTEEFDQLYTQLVDYPIERCAGLYAQYSTTVGASREALDYLGQYVKLTEKEIKMATAKKVAKASAKTGASAPAKSVATPKPAKKLAAVAVKKEAVKKEPKEKGESKPRESAAQMLRDMIMAGNFTDDTIFKKVQDKYGLGDDKRTYVTWYRKDLEKKGMNPPAAKGT